VAGSGGQRSWVASLREGWRRLRGAGGQERLLRALEGRLALLRSHGNDIVLLIAEDGTILDANDRAAEAYGRSREELVGFPISGLRAQDSGPSPAERLAEVRARGGLVFETLQLRRDGTPFPVEISTRLAEVDGHPVFFSIGRDVSERRRAEAALRASEERLKAALEGTRAAVLDWDLTLGVLHVGAYWAALLQLPDGRIEGEPASILARVAHHDDAARVAEPLLAAIAGGPDLFETEFRIVLPDGTDRWARVRGNAVARDARGMATRALGLVTDVTGERQAQARLEVEERMASLGRLAAGVAHEINNPLSYVVSNVDFALGELRRAGPPEALAEAAEALEDALRGARRARDIVRDLDAFTRGGEDRVEAADVRHAVDLALGLAANALRRRGRLSTRFAEVPPVWASPRRLEQVFLNLVINAAEALPEPAEPGSEVQVTVRRAADGRVAVEVADNGCGMSPAVRSRLFEPFFTTKPVGVGTGLGLSVCHGIVRGLGGKIEVESEEGKGSTFRVLLPPVA
jgi:PAS domain S-box-containing protein